MEHGPTTSDDAWAFMFENAVRFRGEVNLASSGARRLNHRPWLPAAGSALRGSPAAASFSGVYSMRSRSVL